MLLRTLILLLGMCGISIGEASTVGVEAMQRWVHSKGRALYFDLAPQERTRPIVVGDIVFCAGALGKVEAFHRTEGYLLWSVILPSKAAVDGAFSYGRSKLFVGDTEGNLYALNARDGSILWSFSAQSEFLSPPSVVHGRVVAATSSDEVYCLGENDGKEKWHYSRRGDEKMTVRGSAAPAIFGSNVYLGFSDGSLTALSLSKGTMVWSKRLRSRDRFYDLDMTPYVDEQSVIAATFDGNLYSLDRSTGEIRWVFHVGSYGGFLVEEDRFYFSGLDGAFYAMDKHQGTVVWKTMFEGGVGSTPARVGNYLVVTTSGDPTYILDPANGQVMWKGDLGAGTLAAATGTLDNWFYVHSNFGNLYGFELQDVYNVLKKGPKTLLLPSAFRRIVRETESSFKASNP